MADVDVAKKIRAHLKKNEDATVAELAQVIGESEADIVRILDEYQVDERGRISHAGVGRGGGWVAG